MRTFQYDFESLLTSVKALMYSRSAYFDPESEEHAIYVDAGDALSDVLDLWNEEQ